MRKKGKWKQKGGLWNTEAADKMGSGRIPYPKACGKKNKTLRSHRNSKPTCDD